MNGYIVFQPMKAFFAQLCNDQNFNDLPNFFVNDSRELGVCTFLKIYSLPKTFFVANDSYLFPESTKTFFESPTRERNTFISVELFCR